jgi:hypothetical protein
LPRHITWNPELQQLVFSPLEEQTMLRGDVIGQVKTPEELQPGVPLTLVKGRGNQSDIVVSFKRPLTAVNLTVAVLVGSARKVAASFTVHYTPPPPPGQCAAIQIHHTEGCFNYSSWKQGSVGPVLPNYQPSVDDAKLTLESCGAACYETNPTSLAGVVGGDRCFCGTAADLATATAKALSAPKGTCETMACKGNVDEQVCGGAGMLLVYAYSCEVGRIPPPPHNAAPQPVHMVGVSGTGARPAMLNLSPADKTIDVRIFTDNVMSEVYFMDGRVAMTMATNFASSEAESGSASCDVTVNADSAGVTLVSATAWGVKSIWVSTSDVLNAPRNAEGADVELMVQRFRAEQQR